MFWYYLEKGNKLAFCTSNTATNNYRRLRTFLAQFFSHRSASGKYLLVNATSMSVSLVLFIAKACLGLLIAQVWNHKLESCEYLLLRVRNYTPSGVTPIYLTGYVLKCPATLLLIAT